MPVNVLLRPVGVCGAAVLALTACGPDDDEPPTGASSSETPGQQSQTPEETDEGSEPPVEIGDEGVPELADIEQLLWESSTSQDSVTILSDIPAEMVGIQESEGQESLDDQQEGAEDSESDEAEPEESVDTAENVEVIIGGDMLGDGSLWQVEGLMDYVLYDGGESIYQTVESFIQEYRYLQPDEAAGPGAEDLGAELEAAGSWVDVSSTMEERIETPQRYIESLDEELLAAAGLDGFSEIGFSGRTENRDGQEVWVYYYESEDEVIELTLLADVEQPLLSELSLDSEDVLVSIRFTDWNESEGLAEEQPEEDTVISEDELDAIGQSLM